MRRDERAVGGGGDEWDRRQIGAFVLKAENARVCEVGGVCPGGEVGRRVDSDGVGLGKGHGHDPGKRGRVPENLGVAELRAADGEDGVVCVLLPGVAGVVGVGEGLVLVGGGVGHVDGDYAVGLVGEETRGAVCVDDGGASEDACHVVVGK